MRIEQSRTKHTQPLVLSETSDTDLEKRKSYILKKRKFYRSNPVIFNRYIL